MRTMKRETFFNAMTPDYNTDDGRELALLDDLRVFMTESKHHNADFFKNIIFLCFNYLLELNGIKDEDGNDILNEIITRELEQPKTGINAPQDFEIEKEVF